MTLTRVLATLVVVGLAVLLWRAGSRAAILCALCGEIRARGGDILFSRRDPWEESYNGALQGGWFGLGYGASYGDTGFSGGLTAVGYGREKCNSQLAVIEETGIVGGVFYVILIFTIFAELLRGVKRAVEPEARMEIALITGLASGLLLQSMFEAWWTSPGSVESALFWSTVGVGSALVRRMGLARTGYAPKIRAHGPSAGPAVVRP